MAYNPLKPYSPEDELPDITTKEQAMDAINSKDPATLQKLLGYINGKGGEIVPDASQAPIPAPQEAIEPEEPQSNPTIPPIMNTPVLPDESKDEEKLSKTIDFGNSNLASQANLQDVQDKANNIRMIAGIMPAVDKINSGLSGMGSGGKYNPTVDNGKFYENLNKQADQGITDYKAKIEMEKMDPNSAYSQGLKDFIKKSYGYDITGDVSAKDLQDGVMKPLEKQYEQQLLDSRQREMKQMQVDMMRENSKDRAAALAETRNERQQRHEDTLNARQEALTTKRLDTLNNKLTASMANSRSAFGNAARNAQSVENAKALLDGSLDYNNLNNSQVFELSRVIDKVLSGGVASQYATKHLTPETARGFLASKMEYITNKRQGAQAGSFVKQSADLLDREGQLAKKQIQDSQAEVLGGMQDLKDNQRFAEILESKGLDPQMFSDENKTLRKAKILEKSKALEQKVETSQKSQTSNKPKRVMQNGHTYILNEQTGKYEPEQLQ